MTESTVRQLAQSDPVPNLSTRWGTTFITAERQLEALIASLRELDELADTLEGKGLTVGYDLGPIGNAAAAARRDLEKRSDRPQFEMPR